MVTAQLVKELRDKTGAGMMDCKNALVATDGDMEKAIDWLREKGISKAAKKASRIAAEGLCEIAVSGNDAYVVELNSETDFVAKNQKFIDLLNAICDICVKNNCNSAEDAEKAGAGDLVIAATAVIGEKLSLRRVCHVTKADDEVFGTYKHNGGKIAVVTVIKGQKVEVAEQVCMHVCAMNPKFLDRNSVDPETIEHEKAVLTQEALNEGKPAAIVEKMVMGRVQKFLKEICLVDQEFVMNPDITVGQFLKEQGSAAVNYVRYEVGEGMEKRQDDFAAEVAAATAAALNK